ncbi:MAG TPA: nitrogenase component 1 [Methanoregulaceae archaeon]|nr:nitrogenase component 1 [Methanoregulaceae archaeon]
MPISRTGGCTLTGALAVTTSITDSVTLIHGPDGCAHHNFSLLHATLLDNGNVRIPHIMSSGLMEEDIIFGGEPSLARAIIRACEEQPRMIFVLSTCITDTIGDDVKGICSDSGANVLYIPTSGFFGGQFEDGFSNALITIAQSVAGRKRCENLVNDGEVRVNLIGEKNLEYEVEQNFDEICRLLSLLGVSVNIRYVHEIRTDDLDNLPLAGFNILREPSLAAVGKQLQGQFGMPYVDSFPIGLQGTLQFLRNTARIAGAPCDDAVRSETEFQQSMVDEFLDLAGNKVHFISQGYPCESAALDEIVRRTGLCCQEDGTDLPAPVPFPIGTAGIRRMLHRWRRALS